MVSYSVHLFITVPQTVRCFHCYRDSRNMVFLMKSIKEGKENTGLPETEERVWTNFTR